MGNVVLKNMSNDAKVTLLTPFDEKQWADALNDLGVLYDQESWMRGYLFDIDPEIEIIHLVTDTPVYDSMINSDNPVLISIAEWMYCDSTCYQSAVDSYCENIGEHDLEEFCNLCMQSDDISYYCYENGNSYEGYGREILRWRFDSGEIPSDLDYYINYEEYGEDMERDSNDYVDEYGYLSDGGGVDVTFYTLDEIVDSANWDLDYEPECTQNAFDPTMVLAIL